AVPPFLSVLLGEERGAATAADGAGDLVARLRALPPAERHPAFLRELQEATARVMSLPRDAVEPRRPLRDLGLDSLMGVELQNALTRTLGRPLPRTLLLDHPTLDALAAHLLARVLDLGEAPRFEDAPPRAEPLTPGTLDAEI